MSLVIAGQVTGSLVFDTLGLLGLTARELIFPRTLGAALVVAGILLLNFGDRLHFRQSLSPPLWVGLRAVSSGSAPGPAVFR